MSDTIQTISRALSADVEGINAVSHNVANLTTPAFKSVRSIPDFGAALGSHEALQTSDGPLSQTGRSFDLALRGSGFFITEHDGQQLLVRAGSFRRSSEGYLVSAAGDRVLTETGSVEIPDGNLRVEEDGSLWVQDQALGRLLIVDVADTQRLTRVAGGYRYDGELKPWSGSVQQGAVEQSNVDAAEQTLRLIELTRHAESMQRAFSIYDKTMDTGINRVGDN